MSDRRIKTTYIKTTYTKISPPEEGEDSDPDVESGWEDEEGSSMEPDEYDLEEGLTAVDKAAAFLKDAGASESSASFFHPGIWYSTECAVEDYGTGESIERSFHLHGFTPDEELGVYCAMNPKDKHAAALKKRRDVAQAATSPHGRCASVRYCVEYRADRRVPSCKNKRSKGRR